jgi:hypothetical protein
VLLELTIQTDKHRDFVAIYLWEFDGPRERTVQVQVLGGELS